MKTIKGPGIFLAQFIGPQAPFNTLAGIAQWAAGLGYKALQIPCNHPAIFDVERARRARPTATRSAGILAEHGLVISELSTHLEGQLVAVHPAYDAAFDAFAPAALHGDPQARQRWAVEKSAAGGGSLRPAWGCRRTRPFPGRWHGPFFIRGRRIISRFWMRPLPSWPGAGGRLLDLFDEQGVDVCYEIHPGEDLHDGVTFERFLALVDNHPRCNMLYDPSHLHLQQMDYLTYIDIYHARIKAFHVKDAGISPQRAQWRLRWIPALAAAAGRFRSPGDGQIDFKGCSVS
ncbi:inosose isomerase [Klebsiella pneumoniae]|uniref:Inosose isomerase n=1 Tax=Klebsiella pneumoniae TaxID=573 RepID=A0A378F7Y1_KLEPN|nr:inosose isomerase [Klebsiella pneumoniae]